MKYWVDTSDSFQKYISLSLLIHAGFLFIYGLKATFLPGDVIFIPDAIRVDMVALPDKLRSSPVEAPSAKKVEIPKAEAKPKAKEIPTKEVPVAKNLKEKQKKAMDELKRREALESISNSMTAAKTPGDIVDKNLKPSLPQFKGNAITSGNSFTGIAGLSAQEYWGSVKRHVQQFWTLPEWLANTPLKASVVVRIDEIGRVVQTDIYRSSGNQAFDTAAISAIEAASPFPVPPEKIRETIAQNWMILNFPE